MIKLVSPQTEEEFKQYFELRWRILRKPWNQALGSEQDNDEDNSYHLMAVCDNKTIAVARLQFIDNTTAQIRYMAVTREFEGQGIGRSMIDHMEAYALKNNINKIMLHARENAIGFYHKMGYTIEEKSYLLFNSIQHYKMTKNITPPTTAYPK
ncbi:MAG: GNAT family N-acetyltransferase [Gammaproteobacteria bacterium]|nr:GNAT family N-acetyltransferase [Gammaproteobacteria bacterium]